MTAMRRRRDLARAGLCGWWTAACLSLGGCGGEPPSTASAPTLEVAYAGCAEVLDGPTCVPPEDRRLGLWIAASAEARVEVVDDRGDALESRDPVDVEGGRLHRVTLPANISHVLVRARTSAATVTWKLGIANRPAEELHGAAAAGYGAMARGNFDEAIDHLTRARRAYDARGRHLSAAQTAASMIFCRLQQRRFADARGLLESLTLEADAPAEAQFQKAFYRGYGAVAVGDSRAALRALEEAGSWARRLGLERESGMSEEVLALQMRQLGRAGDAAGLFSGLHHHRAYTDASASRARLLNNHAWTLLLAREAGESVDDPLPLLQEAMQLFDSHAERLDQRVNVRLNAALAYLHAERPQEAHDMLVEAASLSAVPPAHLRLWWLDIEARIALAQRRHGAALELYARLERLAESSFAPEGRWRAAVGRGRTLMAMGKPAEARRALATAERLLDEQSLLIPLDQGRETFMAQQGASVRLYLELLLDLGHVRDAYEAARRSRSRLLRSLRYQDRLALLSAAERRTWEEAIGDYWQKRSELDAALEGDWQLRVDELAAARRQRLALSTEIARALDRAFAVLGGGASPLPEPGAGEVVLIYHPVESGWAGFAALDDDLMVRPVALPTVPWTDAPQAYGAALLAPFGELIAKGQRIRILPFGVLREIDFHSLPFADDILLADRPVIYGLDLETSGGAAAPGSRRALIVADPNGDLAAARREAARVRNLLTTATADWSVEVLMGAAAHSAAVIERLDGVDLLHYAGHGVFSGRDGWESALPLADGTRLTLGDLLALERSPSWVVLSGCETARAAASGVEGPGLAHGFLVAGARQVVAAIRPVEDQAAAELVGDLYGVRGGSHGVPDEAFDLAVQLRAAQLAWRQRGGGDWASFRILEP